MDSNDKDETHSSVSWHWSFFLRPLAAIAIALLVVIAVISFCGERTVEAPTLPSDSALSAEHPGQAAL